MRRIQRAIAGIVEGAGIAPGTRALPGPFSASKTLYPLLLAWTLPAFAQTVPDTVNVDFSRDIYPIFQRSCFECHGPKKQKSGLRLDIREPALVGGEGGSVVKPGNSADSELLRRIGLPPEHEDIMPNRGKLLSAADIDLIRRWIDQGAVWPDVVRPPVHWAYVRPTRPTLPPVQRLDWPRNRIDHFILARLEREKWEPSPEAGRKELVRRLYFGLVGLPPTPMDVERFVTDTRSDAYEKLVDTLLASPRFGERWARHWLDLARYADSNGYQRDGFREIWLYRDWVIDALNRDMPYDQFTIEQLAGDLLPNATLKQKIATGFNRCTNVNVESGVDQEEGRVNQVIDRVNTTATVWMGSTMECAQCHDHKYDPFTQRDYFRFFGYFNSTTSETAFVSPTNTVVIDLVGPYQEIPIAEERRIALEERRAAVKSLEAKLQTLRGHYLQDDDGWEEVARNTRSYRGTAVPAKILEIIDVTAAQRDRAQIGALEDFRLGIRPDAKAIVAERDAVRKQVAALDPDKCLVMEELPAPRPTHLFKRGSFLDPGEAVEPGVPEFFGATPEGPPNRLTLARWLVSTANPMVARATVNRWWSELMGHGLVATPEDFGLKGEKPTHPELLDWLAVELVERGWSMKAILRMIVTSTTYRQSSVISETLLQRDRPNLWYARGPRFQMDAEMIRDNALAVAGLLSFKSGGPSIRPYQPANTWRAAGKVDNTYTISPDEDRYRRGVYVFWRRSTPYPSYVNFDAPTRTACVVKRSRSNTPLQALTLLNDPVYVEAAEAMARRILAEQPRDASLDARIQHAFGLCLSRDPAPRELEAVRRLYRDMFDRHSNDRNSEFVAWQAVAAAMLNLDETITRE